MSKVVKKEYLEEAAAAYNLRTAREAVSYTHLDVYKRQAYDNDTGMRDMGQ